jgi:hypothetical protein
MRDPVRDVGGVVVIPASHLSDYMTGRTLFVDGGRAYFRWGSIARIVCAASVLDRSTVTCKRPGTADTASRERAVILDG